MLADSQNSVNTDLQVYEMGIFR